MPRFSGEKPSRGLSRGQPTRRTHAVSLRAPARVRGPATGLTHPKPRGTAPGRTVPPPGTEWSCRELQLVRLLRQLVRERPRHAAGVIHLDDVPRDQVPEKIRVHAARQIVASRDGAEG